MPCAPDRSSHNGHHFQLRTFRKHQKGNRISSHRRREPLTASQIFTDGRPLPNNDPQPWWFGYSTGKWMGDTLVVETSGFRDGGWLDVNGSPLTDAAKMTERFTRVNYGNLEIEVTVDDPKAYTRPWTVTIKNEIMLDTELIEFICLENEKSTEHFR